MTGDDDDRSAVARARQAKRVRRESGGSIKGGIVAVAMIAGLVLLVGGFVGAAIAPDVFPWLIVFPVLIGVPVTGFIGGYLADGRRSGAIHGLLSAVGTEAVLGLMLLSFAAAGTPPGELMSLPAAVEDPLIGASITVAYTLLAAITGYSGAILTEHPP